MAFVAMLAFVLIYGLFRSVWLEVFTYSEPLIWCLQTAIRSLLILFHLLMGICWF